MEKKKLQNPNNGGNGNQGCEEFQSPRYGESLPSSPPHPTTNTRLQDDIDSSCSTPYVSAPSSPGRTPNGYYFSAPASPMHFVLSSAARASSDLIPSDLSVSGSGSGDFEFSARFPSSSSTLGSMISADELFLNGQIRPMKLSSHLQRPQVLAPLLDLEPEDEEEGKETDLRGRESRLRSRSVHRRARSLSPLRNSPWHEEEDDEERADKDLDLKDPEQKQEESTDTIEPSVSASSSRSSSSGRSSKKWIFLKDFLYRSKSEGRGNGKEKFWSSISFSPSSKDKKPSPPSHSLLFSTFKDKKREATEMQKQQKSKGSQIPAAEMAKQKAGGQIPARKPTGSGKPANGVGKRRGPPPSLHELRYTENRAQMEEMRKRTYLPYRQGLLGCLGFSSKSYGAMNGFAKTLNPVQSRCIGFACTGLLPFT